MKYKNNGDRYNDDIRKMVVDLYRYGQKWNVNTKLDKFLRVHQLESIS